LRSYVGLKSQDVKSFKEIFAFFGKTTPYDKIFKIVSKIFIATPINVLCSNFVKFGQLEIGEIVLYLPDKNPLALHLPLLRGSHPKYARASPRQCAQSAPDFIQICSLSAEL